MDKLINFAMDVYCMPFAITTEKKFKKVRETKNLSAEDFKDMFLHVTNVDAIISTASLTGLDVLEKTTVTDENGKDMVICSIEDTRANRKIIEEAKKEEEEFYRQLGED